MPLKKLKGCSRKAFREGKCNNYQAIRCDKKNNKTKKVVKKVSVGGGGKYKQCTYT